MANSKNSGEKDNHGCMPEKLATPSTVTNVVDEKYLCQVCRKKLCSPRVLSCLHVFCEMCIDKLTIDENEGSTNYSVECPDCMQITRLGDKRASSLLVDYVSSNILGLSTIDEMFCNSCKISEKAMSYCLDCENFLCFYCNQAHERMRCFNNHEVISNLENLKNIRVHKPECLHSTGKKKMEFFCLQCQECIGKLKAANHPYEPIKEAKINQIKLLNDLIEKSKSHILFCKNMSKEALDNLQTEYNNAKDEIEKTFLDYKAVLEKIRDELDHKLETLYSAKKIKITELVHSIDEIEKKMTCACEFACRIVKLGNEAEVLTFKKLIDTQLSHLINNTPKVEIDNTLLLETNAEKFSDAVKDNFGLFKSQHYNGESPTKKHKSEKNIARCRISTRSSKLKANSVKPNLINVDLPLFQPKVKLSKLEIDSYSNCPLTNNN